MVAIKLCDGDQELVHACPLEKGLQYIPSTPQPGNMKGTLFLALTARGAAEEEGKEGTSPSTRPNNGSRSFLQAENNTKC